MSDVRAEQNSTAQFVCVISGEPRSTIKWFKVRPELKCFAYTRWRSTLKINFHFQDGKPLPNDSRFALADADGGETSLTISSVKATDGGVYEVRNRRIGNRLQS